MKTIIIPKRFGYPTLDITVNGRVYTVKSGEEITIEDHLAEAIENAIALEPKFVRNLSKFAQHVEGCLTEINAEDLDGVTSIYAYAFYFNKSITSIVFSNSITEIEGAAFYGCSNLESIRFGDNSKLATIEINAFDRCENLKSVYLPEKPPALASVNAFANIKSDCVFYCKTQESLEAYKSATNWGALSTPYTFVVES